MDFGVASTIVDCEELITGRSDYFEGEFGGSPQTTVARTQYCARPEG